MEHILVIDQGTHASRCILFDDVGKLLAKSVYPVNLYRQADGFIEQNAEEILASIYYCIDQLQQQHDLNLVSAAALVTQRSTIVAWQKTTGKMLSPAISWQDTRAADILKPLQAQTNEIKQITGLPLSAHYGASKIKWLIEHNEHCKTAYRENDIVIAPLASYLIEQLTGITDPVVDHINATRTLLFDIDKLEWSQSMLNKFGIQTHCLPQTRPCLSDYGRFRHHDIPLKLVCGDQNAALFANGMPDNNSLLINIGSGAFVLKLSEHRQNDKRLLDGLAVTGTHKDYYLQEGTVNGAGTALALLYDEIDEDHLFSQLPQWLQSISAPPVFINSVSGLGSPWWNNSIEAHFLGVDADTIELPERSVAIIESIIFLLQNNIELLTDKNISQIIISGGLSKLDGLCQKLADLSRLEVRRTDNSEATATGAAWLLGDQKNWHVDTEIHHFLPHKMQSLDYRSPDYSSLDQRYLQFKQQLTKLCN